MSAFTQSKTVLDNFFGGKADLTEINYQELGVVLNRQNAILLLQEAKDTPSILAEIASRSYRHSQGFAKIVLIDDREGSGYKLRFHAWPKGVKEGASPITEDKHGHRWDFASNVMGKEDEANEMENHRYKIRKPNEEEQKIWGIFDHLMQTRSAAQAKIIISLLDKLEVEQMRERGMETILIKNQGRSKRESIEQELASILGISKEDIGRIVNMLFKYRNKRDKASGNEIYTPQGPMIFDLQDIQHYVPDTLYFHPVELAHRLVLSSRAEICSLLVTGPVHPDQNPGEFVRSTAGRDEIAVRGRETYSAKELGGILENWINYLKAS